jgi:hypothetical protein
MASGRRRSRTNRRDPSIPLCRYDERTVESEVARVATSAFDDFSRSR